MITEITVLYDHNMPTEFQAAAMYRSMYNETAESYKAKIQALKEYCANHSIFYYARPRESFFMSKACALAEKAGCKCVLVEDMS